jgi:hypothetical protein
MAVWYNDNLFNDNTFNVDLPISTSFIEKEQLDRYNIRFYTKNFVSSPNIEIHQ